ncbi:fumarylacetoacetate hydrolase family protein [Candidatus Entotheonella palauensis]|uniref:fumarylacetoacetate hydrolase family protein n=1 Tax=Candidatus Entotheonella palauensis TaxID=93172 RepID=UPI000B7FE0C5|nr:fumarylacetoacetate hydrolase family protein [Candidatus Entotheonella palauensis]
MKFVLFNDYRPGLLQDDGVVDLSEAIRPLGVSNGQEAMEAIITHMDDLAEAFSRLQQEGEVLPLTQVALRPPLPQPKKILCMGGNYREFGARQPAPMWGFLKSPSAIIGPGDTVVLPPDDVNIFHHEAELVLVFGRSGQAVTPETAMDHVFGYLVGVDVSARLPMSARPSRPRDPTQMPISPWKSFDTFAPIGSYIVTKDEVPDPHHLQIRLWVDGELRVNYNTDDLAHSIPESIAWASAIESFSPGDLFFIGTNHQGLGPMQEGDHIDVEIERVGGFSFQVTDPLQRRWLKGVDELTAQDIREGTGPPGSRQRPL